MGIQIKISRSKSIKVKTQIVVPDAITVLDDIDLSNVEDGYVLMYNGDKQEYEFVDPDEVLSKAVEDNYLPQDFIDKLDIDLDDRIDLDSGEF